MKLKRCEPKKARIEIIPMIDMMFFLLAFFMIASLAMTTMKGMPVSLPQSSMANDRALDRTVITITSENQFYVDKEMVEFEQIFPILKERLDANPKMVVVINCDKDQNWGRGIEVMDEAKKAGAKLLTIATEPKIEKG